MYVILIPASRLNTHHGLVSIIRITITLASIRELLLCYKILNIWIDSSSQVKVDLSFFVFYIRSFRLVLAHLHHSFCANCHYLSYALFFSFIFFWSKLYPPDFDPKKPLLT